MGLDYCIIQSKPAKASELKQTHPKGFGREEINSGKEVNGKGVIALVVGISKTKPKLFRVAAAAPLTSLSTLLGSFHEFLHDDHSLTHIGHLPKGLNPPSSNMLYFSGPYLALAIKTGIITGILSLTEGVAVGRTFASLKNYQVDGNKEMMAIGLRNISGSCSSCYVTTGSFSRSAVNYNAGAQTVVSNIIMASAVLITLLFLMPLFYYTPNVILAAIIITAVSGLIDYQAAYRLWKADKLDFMACMCSFGVLFISVPFGLAIAVRFLRLLFLLG
ncbi:probable sulfate transporter 3.4 [Pyrus x bretschneideri]|uniref:probable sulfate transporter 3.4 n=1 Tax=Pyrus x bretschneideri TaxID=225117 RepID=UPI002030D284|nr:probable sulfate transporter 3.4 [Pyrus x bretschneideri]